MSDKNRIAESRHPTLDKKTLEELKRAGPPKMPSAAGAAGADDAAAATAAAPQQQNQRQGQQMAQLQPGLQQDNPEAAVAATGNAEVPGQFRRSHVAGLVD